MHMWYRILGIILLSSCVVLGATVINNHTVSEFTPDLDGEPNEKWEVFDSLMRINQPNAARKQLDAILKLSIEKEEHFDIYRSYLNYARTLYPLEPNDRKSLFVRLDSSARNLPEPSKSLAQIVLVDQTIHGHRQWFPYGVNVDPVYIENDTIEFTSSSDRVDFALSIIESLEKREELKDISFESFTELMPNEIFANKYFTTVYDFTTAKLIGYYRDYNIRRYHDWKTSGKPTVKWFFNPNDFISVNFNDHSLHHKILSLYQRWESHHFDDKEILSTIHYDRLKYIFESETVENPMAKWQSAFDFYKNSLARSKFLFEKARLIYDKGQTYHFETNKEPKDKIKEAYRVLNDELEKYPENDFVEQINRLIDIIEQPQVSFQMQNTAYPGDKLPLKINHQNIDSAALIICEIPDNIPKNKSVRQLLKDGDYEQVRTRTFSLVDRHDFQERSSEYLLDGIDTPGRYYMVMAPSYKAYQKGLKVDSNWRELPKATHSLTVSQIMVNTERVNDGLTFLITDYKSGEPIEGAGVKIYYNRRIDLGFPSKSGMTDEKGKYFAQVSERSIVYEVSYNNSEISSSEYIYYYDQDPSEYNVKILTDRAIYRPGQTVHYKIIAYKGEENEFEVAKGKQIHFEIRNSSSVNVLSKDLTTNEYGSASGSFTLPFGGPFGSFSANARVRGEETNYSYHSFRVEEYKRPTFETEINLPEKEAKLNDSVNVVGVAKAFAGYPITGAKVNYKIYRNWNVYWRYWGNGSQGRDLIADTTIKTNEDGEFDIDFFAKTDPNAPDQAYYNFEIIADVIDVSGETHEARTNLSLSKTGLRLTYSGKKDLTSDKEAFGVYTVQNMAGKVQEGYDAYLEIYKVIPEERFLNRIWTDAEFKKFESDDWINLFPYSDVSSYDNVEQKEEKIGDLKFETGDSLTLNDLIGSNQGEFKLRSYVVSEKGDTIRNFQTLSNIVVDAKEIPTKEMMWLYQSQNRAEVGEKIQFQIGSSVEEAKVLYQIRRGQDIIQEKWIKAGKRVTIDHVVKEVDRGGISLSATMIYDGKRYSRVKHVDVPFSNKQLTIKAETFRDKLLPGQKEKWKFTISGEGADKLAAEVCAGMYDASLDKFAANYWSLWPYRGNYYYNSMRSAISRSSRINKGNAGWADRSYYLRNYFDSPLNISGYRMHNQVYFSSTVSGSTRGGNAQVMMKRSAGVVASADMEEAEPAMEMDMMVTEEANDEDKVGGLKDYRSDSSVAGNQESEKSRPTKEVQVRENFNETAFFYPDLQTNEKGEFVVSFTLPESLTEWKFMALAHTNNMKVGQLNLSTVAQKPLMVTSNAPRFLRNGDHFDFTSKVINLTEEDQKVEVELNFFDPTNDKAINLIGRQPRTKTVKIPAGKSKEVVWNLNLNEVEGLIAYKVTAANEEFSDGEQKALPVLTNRKLVMESMPFVLPKGGTTDLTFAALLNNNSTSLVNERYVLEYTSNPSWNAVLALPYLAEYPYECAEQVFSRYYANSIAATVVERKPKIKAMFDEWRKTSPEVFMSQLQKNEELKTILLEETPWILDAKDEAERKRRIAELFEINQLARNQEKALHLLSKKQNSDGGFGWFGGNRSNVYITQHIVAGFGHLKRMNIELPDKAERMIKDALSFLDDHYYWSYKRMTEKQRKNAGISSTTLHWMYASSYFDHAHSRKIDEVLAFYLVKLREHWSNLGLQHQALAGIYFHKINDQKHSKEVLASLRDRAKKVDDEGMYFPENNGGFYWSDSKIETHAIITEFFAEVSDSKEEVDALRLWLILQKRSNSWENTKATALATYALLMNGTDYIGDESQPSIKVGETELVFNKKAEKGQRSVKLTPGLGYLKTTWSGGEINKDLSKISISKSTSTPSYGAVYWQYFEDMSKIKASGNEEIQVERTYRKVVPGSKGDEYIESNEFNVGDRVNIKLVVTVENDLEYVHLKDLRPAGFEPLMAKSMHHSENRLWYYQSPRDVSMNYFIDWMPKGTHVFNYEVYVTSSGQFDAGNATVQCMYAPEFTAHSSGEKVIAKP